MAETKVKEEGSWVFGPAGAELWDAVKAFTERDLKIVKGSKVKFTANGKDVDYTHAELQDILNDVEPVWKELGLFVNHWLDSTEQGEIALVMSIRHFPSRQEFITKFPLVMGQKDPQKAGGAITYFRRYSIGAFFKLHLVEDDDAVAATYKEEDVKAEVELRPIPEGVEVIDAAQIKELSLAPGQAKLTKPQAEQFWKDIKEKLHLTRGKMDDQFVWTGTNIVQADVPIILEKLAQRKERLKVNQQQ